MGHRFWQPHRDNQDWADDWDFAADPWRTRRLRVWVEVAGFASLDSTPGRSPHLPCILVRSTPVGEYDADAGYIPIRRQVVDIRVYESWNIKDVRTIPTVIQTMNRYSVCDGRHGCGWQQLRAFTIQTTRLTLTPCPTLTYPRPSVPSSTPLSN